jgi:hypothetical protein
MPIRQDRPLTAQFRSRDRQGAVGQVIP